MNVPLITDKQSDTSRTIPLIFLIEDDFDLAEYVIASLSENYQTEKVYSGENAVSLITKLQPDLVISDVMLPVTDGLTICKLLKSNIETCHIPIILLTAKASEENVIQGYETGADIYMAKPFNIKILETQASMLIESRRKLREMFSKQVLLQPKDVTITSLDEKFLKRLIDVAEENIADPDFDVSKLVETMNMSHTAILRKFKALTDQSLVEFIKSFRLKKAALIFQKEKLPISEVSYMVGFSDPKYFSKCFVKEIGKTPSDYILEFHKSKGTAKAE